MSKQTLEQKFDSMTPARLFKWLVWILVVASAVIATVFILYFGNFKGNLSFSNSDWGTFGDFIGGTLNPVLSFLSLIALLLTIVLQSKELESTRMELERSASAQESTEKILNEQSKTFARQQFESTFFSLLDQHNKALENLTSPLAGRRGSKLDQVSGYVLSARVINLSDAKAVLETKNNLCGHYFRVLYQLLKFVATNAPGSTIGQTFEAAKIQFQELTSDEKMYSNIVRSFLGYDVTQLLSINCYCSGPTDIYWRYKLLIERYAFLEHMPFEINDEENRTLLKTKSFYEPSAFGNSNFVDRNISV
jgi:uncharacterized membrane protein